MTREPSRSLDALDGAGSGLRVLFWQDGDRFAHAIAAVVDAVETPLLFADELPLQEVVEHRTFDGRPALLATGAGGGRYWSLAVEPIIDVRLAVVGFDVACRDWPEAPPPAVRYRVAGGVTQEGNSLLLPDGRKFAAVSGILPVSLATAPASTCHVEASARGLALVSARAPHASTPKQTRWRYEFELVA